MWQAIKQYNGASLLFENTEGILTNTDQNTVYFWSSDPIDKVKANYEKAGLSFISGNAQKEWWIAAYNKDGTLQALPVNTSTGIPITHQLLCIVPERFNWSYLTDDGAKNAVLEAEKTKEFGCITMTLVKTNQANLCSLLPVYPGNRGSPYVSPKVVTPYENCSRFPKDGTLIIFNYYLEGM